MYETGGPAKGEQSPHGNRGGHSPMIAVLMIESFIIATAIPEIQSLNV